jgi:hypothetical protein
VARCASLGHCLAGRYIRSARAPAEGDERGRRAERNQQTMSVHHEP